MAAGVSILLVRHHDHCAAICVDHHLPRSSRVGRTVTARLPAFRACWASLRFIATNSGSLSGKMDTAAPLGIDRASSSLSSITWVNNSVRSTLPRVFDPACSIGDLRIASTPYLPISNDLAETLEIGENDLPNTTQRHGHTSQGHP